MYKIKNQLTNKYSSSILLLDLYTWERNVEPVNKQIVFDMDGVIFDTENLVLGCWRFVAEKYNIPHIEETYLRSIGTTSEETKDILYEVYGEDFFLPTFWQEWKQQYANRVAQSGLPVKRGVRELLGFLKINGYRIGLASSSRYEAVRANLTTAGILDFFEVIVGGDMVKRSKPEPDIYQCACEKMKIVPQETLAIEDSYNGIRSASRAGLSVILVPDLIPPNEEMEELAYAVFEDLIDVRNYLAEHGPD